MMMKRFSICVFLFILLAGFQLHAQNQNMLGNSIINNQITTSGATDTIISIQISDEDLNKVVDIRKQFEKQNSNYSAPARPSENLLRFLKKDELNMSEEALYWAHLVRDASTIFDSNLTFNDTVIVNPLFMPILFKGDYLPHDLTFYNFDALRERTPYDKLYPTDTIFKDITNQKNIEDMAYKYVQNNYPTHFRYSLRDLPNEIIKPKEIKKNTYEDIPIRVESEASFDDVSAPTKFIPERRYWKSGFESMIQFAQNYISENWNNGGNSNLNLTTRQYLRYDYNKDKIQFTNEMEFKLNMNTLPSTTDSIHPYKVNDDVLRLHSNFGYKAFNRWYYTFDFAFKTQLVKNYQQESENFLAAFLSPMQVVVGLGMKYDLDKSFKNKYKKLKFSINIAPISYKFLYSLDKSPQMDLARHGFEKKDEKDIIEGENPYNNKLDEIGSNIEANLAFSFNRNVSWTSRFNYFTTYHRMVGEFENTLNLQISRFFSTRINLQVRYDDGVPKKENFKSYFQINELLSFGFNYKW